MIATLEKIYGDVVSNGRRVFPGRPVGAEVAGANGRSGWDNWIVRQDGRQTTWASFGETFFRYMAFPERNPNYDLASFDLDKDPARLEWIHSVLARMGASTSGFFRLFMVPGMFHCSGGIGTGNFDMLAALREWVEHGAAPDRVPAARVVDNKTVRTRPLCPYPRVARYTGSGSIDEAANLTCGLP